MSLPTGVIIVWSGAIVNIPAGWILCNGANGTPDLRNRFLVGAGDIYAVDANGGSVLHNHGFTSDGHQHDLPAGTDIAAGSGRNKTSNINTAAGTTNNDSSLPPYYALAYIMKT